MPIQHKHAMYHAIHQQQWRCHFSCVCLLFCASRCTCRTFFVWLRFWLTTDSCRSKLIRTSFLWSVVEDLIWYSYFSFSDPVWWRDSYQRYRASAKGWTTRARAYRRPTVAVGWPLVMHRWIRSDDNDRSHEIVPPATAVTLSLPALSPLCMAGIWWRKAHLTALPLRSQMSGQAVALQNPRLKSWIVQWLKCLDVFRTF